MMFDKVNTDEIHHNTELVPCVGWLNCLVDSMISLGIKAEEVKMATRRRKGYWRMGANRLVQNVMTNRWLQEQGVPDMRALWIDLHYPAPKGRGV